MEHFKIALIKVGFDSLLFGKELRKTFKRLQKSDSKMLKDWLNESTYI